MNKTNVELLEFFGLKIGDKIKVKGFTNPLVIREDSGKIFAKPENCLSSWDCYDVGALTKVLLEHEYEIVTPKKKIGDMKCERMLCSKCPLRATDCNSIGKTLYKALEKYIEYLNGFDGSLKPFEKTFIDAIKAELDKEI